MSEHEPCQATEPETLEQAITDCRVPKNEREWWAHHHIEEIQSRITQLENNAACDKHALEVLEADRIRLEQTNATHKEHIQMVEKHRQAAVDKADALAGEKDRLIYHCAALGAAILDEDSTDLANESWRALPDDLQEKINRETESLSQVADSKEGD